jgi:protein-disulfide isomerase
MKNVPLLIVTLLGTIALIIGVAAVFSRSAQQAQKVDEALVRGDARLAKGPTSAKVTVVEFSDFQCPACRASQPLIDEVLAKYPNDVHFMYRHFPLVQIHPYATLAAQAAEAAHEQGKFWEFHDKLFEAQMEWAQLEKSEDVQKKFEEYAIELGIDKVKFLERIQSEEIKQRITRDVADGNQARVSATPSFFVNGQPVSASQLFETVRQAVEQPQ